MLFEAGDGAPAVLVHPPGVAYSAAFLPVLAEALPSSDAPLLVVVGHVNPTALPCCGIWRRPTPAWN